MVLLRAGRSDSGPAITGTPCAAITMNTNEGAEAAIAHECKSQTNDIITTDAVPQFRLPIDITRLAKNMVQNAASKKKWLTSELATTNVVKSS